VAGSGVSLRLPRIVSLTLFSRVSLLHVPQKIPRLDTTCEKDVDDKFFDACEEQVIELGLPHEPSPALPPVVIVLTPPGDEEPVRSPAQDAPPSPESSRLPAPPARKHEDVFIAIFEKELAKVFAGRTQADGPHAAAAAPTPPAPDASRAPDGALEPGWTWPLLVRGVMVLLAMGMAWTTFLLIGLWNCYTAS